MFGGIVISERLISGLLGVLLAVAMVIIVGLCIHNWQLNYSLTEANKSLAQHAQNAAVLGEAVRIQNEAVDGFMEEAEKSIQKSEQAMADLKPFVEEEERRILGIRSAQYSSASSDASERLESIRQKMLQDALL